MNSSSRAGGVGTLGGLLKEAIEEKKKASRRKHVLVIGCDLGTSCTKVVVRDDARGIAVAIPLAKEIHRPNAGAPSDVSDFLLPTGKGDPKFTLMTAIKNGSLQDPLEHSIVVPLVIYLSIVLEQSRAHFLKQVDAANYADVDLIWQVNLGVPCRRVEGSQLAQVFRVVGLAAAHLAWSDRKSAGGDAASRRSLDLARNAARSNWALESTPAVEVIPEVIAEIQGYRRSPKAVRGLHAIIDVGATTVDLATFVIHEHEGESIFPILAAEVLEIGCSRLYARRIARMDDGLKQWRAALPSGGRHDKSIPEADVVTKDAASAIGGSFNAVDRETMNEFGVAFHKLLKYTREKRDPNSRAFDEGLRVFVCGGGKGAPAFAAKLASLFGNGKLIRGTDLQRVDLEIPEQLARLSQIKSGYDRLAVAYGLSFPAIDYGQVRLPESIADIEPQRDGAAQEFAEPIGKEQV